jgi:predicted nucleotidyltransferase component of viral defense system
MSVSLEYLNRCAARNGFPVSSLEKVVHLGEMAREVARHGLLGHVLALKGGTALNLCFGSPKRLSVDLDFNYMGHAEREKMLSDRPRVEQAVAELARRKGYRVQQSRDAFAGRKMYLHYRSVLGPEDRIEVDLNFLFRVPVARTRMAELWQPGELDRPEVKTVSLQEITIGKMLAMLDRGAARDIWDMANLPLPAVEVMERPLFREWFIALAAILDHPLPTYTLARLKGLATDRAVSEQLAPMLRIDTPISMHDLVRQAWEAISRFTTLGPNEAAYMTSIQQGEVKTDLLFEGDPEEGRRAAGHPAILWKLANVRKYLARRSHKT